MANLVKVDHNPFSQQPKQGKLVKVSGNPFQQQQPEQPQIEKEKPSFGEFLEPLATLGTGMVAEPIAGIAGAVQALNPFADEGAGARAVEATRSALTYKPQTERGGELLGEVGEFVAPAGEAIKGVEKGLGDSVFKSTGSPTLAAAAASIPTAIMEILPLAATRSGLKSARITKNKLKQGQIAREINEAIPTIEQLKDTARGVYKEIDEMGVVVDSTAFDSLSRKLSATSAKAGLDPTITPKAQQALKRFAELEGGDVSLTDIETLRKVAQNVAGSIEPTEAALGVRMIEGVDDFLDTADPSMFKRPKGVDAKNVGQRYKAARNMWGRARRSEMLQDAFENARNQATGFENGVRTQFRQILNNKKKNRFFTKDELGAMKAVVRGDRKQNIAKLIGRLGFSEGSATNIIGGSLGVAAGASIGGAPGAVIVPLIGQVSRKLAQRMTVKGAEFADQVIRAGKNGKKITAAYMKNTPKAQRSAQELSELLTRGDIDMLNLVDDPIVRSAKQLATQRRVELAAVAAAPTLTSQEAQ